MRGSPPRVREEAFEVLGQVEDEGITPACAGRSLLIVAWSRLAEDHPRVCGKKRYGPSLKLP